MTRRVLKLLPKNNTTIILMVKESIPLVYIFASSTKSEFKFGVEFVNLWLPDPQVLRLAK